MQIALRLIAGLTGLGVIALAFVYLFDPHRAANLLKKFSRLTVQALIGLIAVWYIVARFTLTELVIGLVTTSLAAYVIRERLHPRRPARPAGPAERTPVMPRSRRQN